MKFWQLSGDCFATRPWNFLILVWKGKKIHRKSFSPNCFYAQLEGSFENPGEKFPTKGRRSFSRKSENLKKNWEAYFFSEKNFYLKTFVWFQLTCQIQFWQTWWKSSDKRLKIIGPMFEKDQKYKFPQKIFGIILRTRRKQLWQACTFGNIFATRPNIFCSTCEDNTKN